jgi:hypothetical protein
MQSGGRLLLLLDADLYISSAFLCLFLCLCFSLISPAPGRYQRDYVRQAWLMMESCKIHGDAQHPKWENPKTMTCLMQQHPIHTIPFLNGSKPHYPAASMIKPHDDLLDASYSLPLVEWSICLMHHTT